MRGIRILIFQALLFTGSLSFSQSSLTEIVKNYNRQVPINFGELSLTSVQFNDSYFSYSYSYENTKEEWSEDAKLGAIYAQGMQISKSINELVEFQTIRKSGKTIVFLYSDNRGEPIYGIVYPIKDGKYEIDPVRSMLISGITVPEK